MKADKRFWDEFANPVSYKIEPSKWLPWLLDRVLMLTFLFCILSVGALIQHLLPIMIWVFGSGGALGMVILIVTYVVVLIADANDYPED